MMVLVDTSVWIDHLRSKEPLLVNLLKNNQVLVHPFVRGELALGNLPQRQDICAGSQALLGNPVSEAPASRVGKLELLRLYSQAGAWERAKSVFYWTYAE